MLSLIWGKAKLYAALALGALLAIAAAFFKGRSEGKQVQRAATDEAVQRNVEKANAAQEQAAAASPAKAQQEISEWDRG